MFANWDWVSFLTGVIATIVIGGGMAMVLGIINLDDL